MTLFDTMTSAQNGQAMELLARQFDLSRQQAELAVEALLPAFSQGLKRNTAEPNGLGAFMAALAGGQYGPYFENAAKAFSPQGIEQGNDMLGWLFGSRELSQAVAAQAAQATGIGQKVLAEMLPVVAAMMMGGLTKQAAAQGPGFGSADNPFAQVMAQMMKQAGAMAGAQPAAQPRQAPPGPFDPFGNNPFLKAWQDMIAAGMKPPASEPEPAPNPFAGNPWAKSFADMMGGGRQPGASQEQAPTRPAHEPKAAAGRQPAGHDDPFGQMFETGRRMREDYEKGIEAIFEQYGKGGNG